MNNFNKTKVTVRLFLILLWSVCGNGYAESDSLSITHVSATPSRLTTETSGVSIQFQLNKPASVVLTIYDARNLPVDQVVSDKSLPVGEHALVWSPRNKRSHFLPEEAYVYTLVAKSVDSDEAVYDLTDITGGETVYVEDIEYDPATGKVRYYVPKTARIFLRVGVENGFVIRTLVNGAIREAGFHEEMWNGKDVDGAISLNSHPKLRFYGSGYSLSQNSLIVTSEKPLHQLPSWLDENSLRRNIAPRIVGKRPKGLNRHFYHPVEQCRDIIIDLQLPKTLKKDSNNVPVVTSSVPLRIFVSEADGLMIEAERSEVVFFLDNQLLYENETSYYPYTWHWNSEGVPEGVYSLTAFIAGFKEHFGIASTRVHVRREHSGQIKDRN